MSEVLEKNFDNINKSIPFEKFDLASTNNFFFYFAPTVFGDIRRSRPHYEVFEKKFPEEARRLMKAFDYLGTENTTASSINIATQDGAKSLEKEARKARIFEENKEDLYAAYLVMRESVGSDNELFV